LEGKEKKGNGNPEPEITLILNYICRYTPPLEPIQKIIISIALDKAANLG